MRKVKEVLIISHETFEITVEHVMDWILFFEHKVTRFNGDLFDSGEDSISLKLKSNAIDLNFNNKHFKKNYYSIWFRRWSYNKKQRQLLENFKQKKIPLLLAHNIINNANSDNGVLFHSFLKSLQAKKRLTHFDQININKLEVLISAKELKIEVPNFLITNSKEELFRFSKFYPNVITKDLSYYFAYEGENNVYVNYTSVIQKKDLDKFPDYFGMSFFQEYIEKEYEVRTFFLGNKYYSMAIFSQGSEQTRIDFRNYDNEKPNRTVPILLPEYLIKKLRLLMKKINLITGSIDIIKCTNGKYYFLEVNPVGQFGMVSFPCNYNLEYEVAQYLCK